MYGEEEGSWRGRGRGAGGTRSFGAARSYEKSGSGSDSLSWRKDGSRSTEGKLVDAEKGEEVTSPYKLPAASHRDLGRPKKLIMDGQAVEGELVTKRDGGGGGGKHVQVELTHSAHADGVEVYNDTNPGTVSDERLKQLPTVLVEAQSHGEMGMPKKGPGQWRFKRVGRENREGATCNQSAERVTRIKMAKDGEGEKEESKRGRLELTEEETREEAEITEPVSDLIISAGLLEQPRRIQ
ncbi:hypothetical protein ZWY2020_011882 [Hordeum vulgare]|nr:hypothetical protein ZWY2020_011882 [Hordeum vulgare]